MPLLVEPSLPAGSLNALDQPSLSVGDGLVLRPWRDTDAEVVMAAFDCPDVQRWHVRRMDTREEALDWIGSWAARWQDETDASWAISRDDQPIGQAGLRHVSLFEGSAALSYWVLPEARGAGIAARAAQVLTEWAFETLGLHRVSLEHSTANTASCRVAARLGFAVEGTSRGSARHADGWHDMHQHARVRRSHTVIAE
ncbi:GNAT family N-acetyltransferase [Lentzea cavernae]|uniref:Acetyltransferase n=1 Tax=Lentzea cavernae TaxID=2020703 RepID=A0ABQ3LVX4_9PSEU|nr:GNAT family N-acetyltransferase [Lentzea cavernae]GHH27565.1 acetyltransferase [Lentzea cavernae]